MAGPDGAPRKPLSRSRARQRRRRNPSTAHIMSGAGAECNAAPPKGRSGPGGRRGGRRPRGVRANASGRIARARLRPGSGRQRVANRADRGILPGAALAIEYFSAAAVAPKRP